MRTAAPIAAGQALFPWLPKIPLVPAAAVTSIIVVIAVVALLAAGSGGRRPALPLRTRVRWRMWPGPGFARGRIELRRCYGLSAARRIARRGRPSLSWRDRRLGPWQAYAGYVGRAHGWLWPRRVYTHYEQLRLTIAPPQKGKSAAAAGVIIDDPGPVVATSIRGDLIAASAGPRQKAGTVHVFNPEGAGSFGSTISWNPVSGCQDMSTAARRAGYMVEGVNARGLDDASFWQDQASMVLAALLHAAGLAAGSMRDVYRWVLASDPQPLQILENHPGAAEFAAGQVRAYLALPDKTKAGISTTLNGAMRFMQDPAIAEILCPPGAGTLDIGAFLRSRDTLYLVVSDAAQSPVPPVFTMLVAEIAHVAKTVSGASGRLDPPLTLELDEIGNTAPVPVAAWATWAAGSGIRIHVYAQSYSQLVQRWKEHGAETLWQSCDVRIIHGHTAEEGLARRVEQACGKVRVRSVGSQTQAGQPGQAGARTYTWTEEPVLPAALLLQLPAGRAVVIAGGARPVIVRTERYWRRRDVRRFARAGRRADLPAATPLPVPVPDPALLAMAPPSLPGQPGPLEEMLAVPVSPGGDWAAVPGDWAAADISWPGVQGWPGAAGDDWAGDDWPEDDWPGDELAARRRTRRGQGHRLPEAGGPRPEAILPLPGDSAWPWWWPAGAGDENE